MRFRLVIFSILFLSTILAAILLVLLISGVFHLGNKETMTLFENELIHVYNSLYDDYGDISARSIDLSKALNKSIEDKLDFERINPRDLKSHPEVYNDLLESVCQTLVTALMRTKSSAVFIILDGTINPELPYSEYSKAGIYIRNMEPNVVNLESPYLHMLRGSTEVAKKNGIMIHPQWAMEFDIQKASFFTKTVETARNNSSLPVSKLYYWCSGEFFPEAADKVMLCSVPLVSSDGFVYGVCGFEVSSLLFKLSYSPDISNYDSSFCLFSPYENDHIDCSLSFMAAKYPAVIKNEISDAKLSFQTKLNSLNKYFSSSKQFMGLHKKINLYPNNSPYVDEEWVVSVMVPVGDYMKALDNINQRIALLFLFLFITGIIASFWFSKIYLNPITETISKIISTKPSNVEKTNIIEIDDLLEFLAEQDRKESEKTGKKASSEYLNTDMFRRFLKNIETLSPAEKAVFDLYMQGLTGKEIAEKLYLSINTIKTHNKRIYEKLEVSSRNELMVYIRMMKEMDLKG
jgi:RNA polymerase sigma factor (sigma-70 family)